MASAKFRASTIILAATARIRKAEEDEITQHAESIRKLQEREVTEGWWWDRKTRKRTITEANLKHWEGRWSEDEDSDCFFSHSEGRTIRDIRRMAVRQATNLLELARAAKALSGAGLHPWVTLDAEEARFLGLHLD